MLTPRNGAIIGLLLALPMGILFSSIIFEIAWIESIFTSVLTNDGTTPNTLGFVFMGITLLALPIAMIVTMVPTFQKDANGRRRVHIANLLVLLLIVALMVPTWGALVTEVYRCDILGIPNCD